MGIPALIIPTQDSNIRREESVRVPETSGVQERGETRENSERGKGGVQNITFEAVGTSAQDATRLESDQRTSSSETIPSATSDHHAEGLIHDADVEDDNLQHNFGFLEDVSLHHDDMEIDTAGTEITQVLGDIRRSEGDIVENIESVRQREIIEKEYAQDISRPLMQLHTLASHSTASQQAVVSSSHGGLAQTLFAFHSEMAGIETRAQLPHSSTSLFAPSSLEPIGLSSFIPRTQPITSAITGRLSDPVGTPVVSPQSGLQGSGGSPVIATEIPTLNTGHIVGSSTVVSTGSLRDPRVIFPDFVSKEYLDGALKAVEKHVTESLSAKFEEEIAKVKSLLKGKGPAVEEPVQPPPPPPVQLVDHSVEELKSMLYAKLLSQATAEDSDADLVGLLRAQQTPISSEAVSITEFNAFKTEMVQHSLELTKAVQD
ncbi:hypothetical protein L6452_19984 [Arctium lappa]|uniref:Uncharacterized protein n=1 Tax=Arctium lappa TaxID=4217 RepID=A0ACB9BAZ7_ARCLA|nr:hypothetical protein L6452_19984 [Arctium lappa]